MALVPSSSSSSSKAAARRRCGVARRWAVFLSLVIGSATTQRGAVVRATSSSYEEAAKALATRLVRDSVKAKRRLAAAVQPRPTEQRPFVFLHQRKAGGSSVRRMIMDSARRQNMTFWVTCFFGVDCNTYDMPLLGPPHAVYAGHLYYPSVVKALTQRALAGPWVPGRNHPGGRDGVDRARFASSDAKLAANFDCLTIFREPVARVKSCWNYRFGEVAPGLQALSAGELRRLLPTAMSMYGEGCNNEPLRVLSDVGHAEETINNLTAGPTDGQNPLFDATTGWSLDAFAALGHTIMHMQTCVVGVLERCRDTAEVVKHHFPWLAFDCGVRENRGVWGGKGLDPAVVAEVRRQNALEVLAYDAAHSMLDAQLKAVRALAAADGQSSETPPHTPPSTTGSGISGSGSGNGRLRP